MANHWDIDDSSLIDMLNSYLDWLLANKGAPIFNLFKNDFNPQPGVGVGSCTAADFPGYAPVAGDWNEFGSASVTAHVAESLYSMFVDFTADASGFSSQTIYGYYVTNADPWSFWCERFATPQVILPSAVLKLKPALRQATYPNPV